MENEITKNLYQIVDSFLVEAKDQHGNDRTLERLNADRHLAVENLNNFFLSELKALKEECVGEEEQFSNYGSHRPCENGDYCKECGVKVGINTKRLQVIKAFAKRSV